MDEQWDGVAAARLHRQGLWAPTAADAPAVLDALVAMQGQEFAYALWALAQRVRPADRPGRAEVDQLAGRVAGRGRQHQC